MNVKVWGVALKGVLLGAAVVCSFLGVAAEISIDSSFEINNLSTVTEIFALVKLYNGLNQESWRQLGDETWHTSAFRSFFVVGSLDATQMNALAEQNNKPDTWNSSNVTINTTSDLISRLKAISTTRYQMSRSITGTGNIKASMWTLMFSCGSTSCSDGYMVPILATKQGTALYSYVTAWLPVAEGVLMNAIPASISNKATQTINFNSTQDNDPNRPSTSFTIQEYLPPCPKARVHSFRTLLDSAYGLAPAITCLGFSDDDSFKIMVTSASLDTGNSDGRIVNQTLETLASLQLNLSEWLPQPFEKCSNRPLLILSEGADSLPHMCHHDKCMIFLPKDSNPTSQIQTELQFLKGLENVLDEGPLQCTSLSNSTITCDSLYNISSIYDLDSTDLEPFTSSIHRSDWASEEGKHTSEFFYAPHAENLTACGIELTLPSSQLEAPKEIYLEAMDYLTAFIKDHNIAFTTAKGPATDPYTFYALVITTALSVITAAVPFTNVMLRAICRIRRLRPLYFNARKGIASKASKVLIQIFWNVGLTVALFLPVLSLARNEMERQIEFSTWAIASDDMVADDLAPSAPNIRVVYLFDLTSQYHSNFLVVIVLVMVITGLLVVVFTAWRCLHVFATYRLLVAADTCGSSTQAEWPNSYAIKQALKAIEMGEAEYLDLQLMHAEESGHAP